MSGGERRATRVPETGTGVMRPIRNDRGDGWPPLTPAFLGLILAQAVLLVMRQVDAYRRWAASTPWVEPTFRVLRITVSVAILVVLAYWGARELMEKRRRDGGSSV